MMKGNNFVREETLKQILIPERTTQLIIEEILTNAT
jgi:hypothetical protein